MGQVVSSGHWAALGFHPKSSGMWSQVLSPTLPVVVSKKEFGAHQHVLLAWYRIFLRLWCMCVLCLDSLLAIAGYMSVFMTVLDSNISACTQNGTISEAECAHNPFRRQWHALRSVTQCTVGGGLVFHLCKGELTCAVQCPETFTRFRKRRLWRTWLVLSPRPATS